MKTYGFTPPGATHILEGEFGSGNARRSEPFNSEPVTPLQVAPQGATETNMENRKDSGLL